MFYYIVTDHFALHMSCFRSVCSYKCTLVIASKYIAFCLVIFDRTVKENNRDSCCFCFFNDLRRSIYRTRCNDVDDQCCSTCLDRCINLFVLCCLVAVSIIVLIFNTHLVKFCIECCTDRCDISIRIGIVEYCDISV